MPKPQATIERIIELERRMNIVIAVLGDVRETLASLAGTEADNA